MLNKELNGEMEVRTVSQVVDAQDVGKHVVDEQATDNFIVWCFKRLRKHLNDDLSVEQLAELIPDNKFSVLKKINEHEASVLLGIKLDGLCNGVLTLDVNIYNDAIEAMFDGVGEPCWSLFNTYNKILATEIGTYAKQRLINIGVGDCIKMVVVEVYPDVGIDGKYYTKRFVYNTEEDDGTYGDSVLVIDKPRNIFREWVENNL